MPECGCLKRIMEFMARSGRPMKCGDRPVTVGSCSVRKIEMLKWHQRAAGKMSWNSSLNEHDLHGRVTRKKPHLWPHHKRHCLKHAKLYLDKSELFL